MTKEQKYQLVADQMRTYLSSGTNVFVDGSAPRKNDPSIQTGLYSIGEIEHEDSINRILAEATTITGELYAIADGLEFISSNVIPNVGISSSIRLFTDNEYAYCVANGEYIPLKHNFEVGQKIIAMMRNMKTRVSVIWIPRQFNKEADRLSKLNR